MNQKSQTKKEVLEFINSQTKTSVEVNHDTPIFEDGLGLDSMGFLDLILSIEQQTGKRLRNESLTEDAMTSVGSLIDYIYDSE